MTTIGKISPLQKITANAKKLRRLHPRMTWQEAVKKAGAAYKRTTPKKAMPTSKKAATKKAAKKTTIKGVTSEARGLLLAKYGQLAQKKLVSTTKRDKTALQKEMTGLSRQIKKLQKF
jgi:hypothetical protein